MKVPFLDLKQNYQSIKEEVNNAMHNVLNKSNYILGEELSTFEKNFAEYIGTDYFSGVGNGTDALEIAINCLDLKEDDEIIVQGNTYVATCFGVIFNKCKLILCDVNRDTFQIDIDDFQKKLNKNTKALIVVPLYGLVPNMDIICDICKKENITLIEDAAQAHGAKWNDKKIGSFGKMACFSFYPGKNLGAYGDGGGIATNDSKLNDKIKKIRNNGSVIKYKHDVLGRNSRLDTIQAAILDVKLKYLDENNKKRREHAKKYYELLKDVEGIELPIVLDNSVPVYHLYVIKTKYRDELQYYLSQKGITTLIHYPISCSVLECFNNLDLNTNNSLDLSNEILSLPMFPELTDEQIEYTCNAIKNMFQNRQKIISNCKTMVTENKNGELHCMNDFNFDTKRFFYIDNFNDNDDNNRGNHANINCDEYLSVLNGKLEIELINKQNEKQKYLLTKNETIFIERNTWLNFNSKFTNTSILVLTNLEYDKTETINDFDKFLQH
jgi:dTDP-4-amino-4,6-dideoxygalactose transaminase